MQPDDKLGDFNCLWIFGQKPISPYVFTKGIRPDAYRLLNFGISSKHRENDSGISHIISSKWTRLKIKNKKNFVNLKYPDTTGNTDAKR